MKGLSRYPILTNCFSSFQFDLTVNQSKMLLPSIVLLVLFNGVLSQGVFAPYTFTQNSCTNGYAWTIWFDTNDPNLTQGDMELTNHIRQLLPTYTCASPTAIEVRTIVTFSSLSDRLKNVPFRLKRPLTVVQH